MPTDRFLVDTSAWLLALRRDFVPAIKDRIDHLLRDDAIITTGMIKLEILSGAKTEPGFRRLKQGLDALESIETDSGVWEEACKLGFGLRRKGVTVPHTDILVAACAMTTKAILIHVDTHFDLIAKHTRLQVESYVREIGKTSR
jgi:predicted nucleic acid-binding protein